MMVDPDRWYPVAASQDLPYRHIYQTKLGGERLAIWRDSTGQINIWKDICPHRGVRLSIGNVLNDELRCQYHSWRFASGSGACSFIPAQPNSKPPSAVRAQPWPVREQGGLVWSGVRPEGEPPIITGGIVLRAMPINRSADIVEAALPKDGDMTLLVQPVDIGRAVVRGLVSNGSLEEADVALERLRRELEATP